MNIQTITMDADAAKKAYRDYHRLVLERRVELRRELHEKGKALGKTLRMLRTERSRLELEDEELMAAYKALGNNQRVINLPQVLHAAGVQPKTFLPALAVARADWKDCHFQIQNSAAYFHEASWLPYRDRDRGGPRTLRVSLATFPAETTNTDWRAKNGLVRYPVRALVPSIPPHLRPSKLEKYFILWDAVWTPAAPVDPFLLKRISRDMFAIVAQWDLTAVERSVLEGRLS